MQTAAIVSQAMQALRCHDWQPASELTGSMSGSGVYRVAVAGRDCVLKVTSAGPGQSQAVRELTFYRSLADVAPVRTPTLLEYARTDDFTALLLSAHSPTPPARAWDRAGWVEVAGQLAALHAIRAPQAEPWLRTPWLRRALDDPPIGVAAEFWSATDAADHVTDLLDAPVALAQALRAVPDTFVHGDCHAANLLMDGEQFVWADWQEAGIGSPAGDLAFLWGRAHADGGEPPREAMLEAYAAGREIDIEMFRRSLLANEIGTLLFGWPEYAGLHTRAEQDRLIERLIRLAQLWRDLQ